MKLSIIATLGILSALMLNAQTTMCYKENHSSIMTIEKTALDGGNCDGKKSVINMKQDGWTVSDIKIENTPMGNNFIYIFKKEQLSLSQVDEEALEQKIIAKLEKKKQDKIKQDKIEIEKENIERGTSYYAKKCSKCHGINAEKKYATANILKDMTFSEFKTAIRDYDLRQKDNGQAWVMYPFANGMSASDVKNVYYYINNINKNGIVKK